MLVDPQVSPVLAQPRSTRDLMVTAFSGWLLVFDNISAVPDWFSDGLCRLATGGGFAGRALYSDGERSVIHAQRPVILNGIDEFVRRDDLADRCVFLHLAPISPTDRRAEVEFWRSFRAEYPAILGGLLDAIVGGLRELPTLELAALPRMADFARFGEAIGRGLGWPARGVPFGLRRESAGGQRSRTRRFSDRSALALQGVVTRLAGVDFTGDEDASAPHGRQATRDGGVGPLAKIASRAHQRAAPDCSHPADKRNYRQIQQNPR